jgi:hypothetical protein
MLIFKLTAFCPTKGNLLAPDLTNQSTAQRNENPNPEITEPSQFSP